MNQGPLDLQSNALPLSYIPDGKSGFPIGIHGYTKKATYHVRARAFLATTADFVQNRVSRHIYAKNISKIVLPSLKRQKRNKYQKEKEQAVT